MESERLETDSMHCARTASVRDRGDEMKHLVRYGKIEHRCHLDSIALPPLPFVLLAISRKDGPIQVFMPVAR